MTNLNFTFRLINWYEENKRNLPWRNTNNPYFIWLSEIILQQTRVNQGLPYFLKFVDNYPSVTDLASANLDEIFKLWQGLGYYNRARNLHAAANSIVEKFGGVFPTKYEDVLSLNGVGEYTAAAIMSFAYNAPYAAVDGNVYRILSRIFGVEDYIDTSAGKKIFQNLATELLDTDRPGLFNQASMEFGALQCVPSSPNCGVCPFVQECFAYNSNKIGELPRKRGKVTTRNRYLNYLDIRVNGKLSLKQRNEKDIWRGLYEFPLIETEAELTFHQLANTARYKSIFENSREVTVLKEYKYKHILSHQIIYAAFYKIETDFFNQKDYFQLDELEMGEYGVSKLIDNYLSEE